MGTHEGEDGHNIVKNTALGREGGREREREREREGGREGDKVLTSDQKLDGGEDMGNEVNSLKVLTRQIYNCFSSRGRLWPQFREGGERDGG